jgi:hypothetical protein
MMYTGKPRRANHVDQPSRPSGVVRNTTPEIDECVMTIGVTFP